MTKRNQRKTIKFLSLYLGVSKREIKNAIDYVIESNESTSTSIYWGLRENFDDGEYNYDLEAIRDFKINNNIK